MRHPAATLSILLLLSVFAAGCAATKSKYGLLSEGIAHSEAGRDNEAVALLTEAAAKPGPELPWLYMIRAGAYLRLGRHDLALADTERFFQEVTDNEDRAHGHLMRGSIYCKMDRNDLCEAEFETVLAMNSTQCTPHALAALERLDNLTFRPEAQRYLGLTVKPDLPEEARKYRIQAEAAVERKSFQEAADRYRDALRVASWWPEGHYNRALLLAEVSRHALAIREMRRYLLLAPDAPDARAAQDQIYKWEALVKR